MQVETDFRQGLSEPRGKGTHEEFFHRTSASRRGSRASAEGPVRESVLSITGRRGSEAIYSIERLHARCEGIKAV